MCVFQLVCIYFTCMCMYFSLIGCNIIINVCSFRIFCSQCIWRSFEIGFTELDLIAVIGSGKLFVNSQGRCKVSNSSSDAVSAEWSHHGGRGHVWPRRLRLKTSTNCWRGKHDTPNIECILIQLMLSESKISRMSVKAISYFIRRLLLC